MRLETLFPSIITACTGVVVALESVDSGAPWSNEDRAGPLACPDVLEHRAF